MPQENRVWTCDVCKYSETEEDFGIGVHGWAIARGIGSCPPEEGQPIRNRNMETVLCPQCSQVVSHYINDMQEKDS